VHADGRAHHLAQGAVYAEADADAAVVQSVLDAINRKLEIYTQEM